MVGPHLHSRPGHWAGLDPPYLLGDENDDEGDALNPWAGRVAGAKVDGDEMMFWA